MWIHIVTFVSGTFWRSYFSCLKVLFRMYDKLPPRAPVNRIIAVVNLNVWKHWSHRFLLKQNQTMRWQWQITKWQNSFCMLDTSWEWEFFSSLMHLCNSLSPVTVSSLLLSSDVHARRSLHKMDNVFFFSFCRSVVGTSGLAPSPTSGPLILPVFGKIWEIVFTYFVNFESSRWFSHLDLVDFGKEFLRFP